MKKRGMVSPVFKYIFALIVGTMFLLFFIRFGLQYMGQQSTIESFRLVSGFDDVLSALGSSTDSNQDYNLGRIVTFTFKPDKENKLRYQFRTGSSSKSINSYKILFTPKTLKGKTLYILTKRWQFPYSVTNFFYLTNSQYKYFIIYDSDTEDFANELAGNEEEYTTEIPSAFGVEIIDKNSLKVSELKKQLLKVKPTFILLSQDSALESKLKDIDNAKVRVVTFDDDKEYGTILFEDGNSYPFMKLPMFIGAIFAEDSKSYIYSVNMALNKLGIITRIYNNKKTLLQNNPNYYSCNTYSLLGRDLDNLLSLARSREYDYNQYKQVIENLEDNNKLLGGDCPEIF
ncbi:hypothetical protein D6777_01700 [Candidatus Woesearchaeota archaeon]|nr:MAG: hypothetical protein D6777_01700 [Candidatus Woesearchaeota archaeon]